MNIGVEIRQGLTHSKASKHLFGGGYHY